MLESHIAGFMPVDAENIFRSSLASARFFSSLREAMNFRGLEVDFFVFSSAMTALYLLILERTMHHMSVESTGSEKPSRIVLVNEADEVIGTRIRGEADPQDIYRVSCLWITNSKGEILIAQRSHSKDKDPGKWSTAVSGTVDEGEEYDDNMVKEAKEELGIVVTANNLRKGPKTLLHGKNRFFCQWYFLTSDVTDFVLQKEEVEAVRWISKEELSEEIAKHPEKFARTAPEWLPLVLEKAWYT